MSTPQTQSFKLKEELLNVINELLSLPCLTACKEEQVKRDQLMWRAKGIIASAERNSFGDGCYLNMIFAGFLCDVESVQKNYKSLTSHYYDEPELEINYALALRFCGLLALSNEHLLSIYQRTHSIDALKLLSEGYMNAGQFNKLTMLENESNKLGVELDELNQGFAYEAERFAVENGISFDDLLTYSENLHSFIYSNSIGLFKLSSYIQNDNGHESFVYTIRIVELGVSHQILEELNDKLIDSIIDLELAPNFLSKVITKFKMNS